MRKIEIGKTYFYRENDDAAPTPYEYVGKEKRRYVFRAADGSTVTVKALTRFYVNELAVWHAMLRDAWEAIRADWAGDNYTGTVRVARLAVELAKAIKRKPELELPEI